MLGILIGISAVILTVGLGLGTQQQVGAQISARGSNLLIVSPGSSTSTTGVRGGFGSVSTLTTADAEALASSVAAPDIGAIAGVKTSSLPLTNGSANWTTSVVGSTASWLTVRSRTLSAGRFITDADNADQAAVAVLGPSTATELFGTTDVVGQTFTADNIQFSVIGVLATAGSDSTANLDDQAIVPISTATNRLLGGATKNSLSTISSRRLRPDSSRPQTRNPRRCCCSSIILQLPPPPISPSAVRRHCSRRQLRSAGP